MCSCNSSAGIGEMAQNGGSPRLEGQPARPKPQALGSVRDAISKRIWKAIEEETQSQPLASFYMCLHRRVHRIYLHEYRCIYNIGRQAKKDEGGEKCAEEARIIHKPCKCYVSMSLLIRELLSQCRQTFNNQADMVTWLMVSHSFLYSALRCWFLTRIIKVVGVDV